ncbi:phospholipase D-like domain-containing protein [Mycobacterium sp. 3519A]|uniref:phospholipase D-like domain-containing protein n=1 Tax=Mycobacterium sp. 3519A TaxID=2057184 RepID=UPI000C7A8916|nr:phospholipase D-like domain-containing protein [Mycobacterium sp. 3519A]
MTDPGTALLELAAAAERNFVMCSPFAKEHVVAHVISAIPDGVDIALYTRWRPEEIAAGVSDTAVLSVLQRRGGAVYLHDRIHAKFYRNEHSVLAGSANLTSTALGWAVNSNLELLLECPRAAIQELESLLELESIRATEALAAEADEIAQLLPRNPLPPPRVASVPTDEPWIPRLRMPSDLYLAYSRGASRLSSTSAEEASADLAALDVPVGLGRDQFYAVVAHRLRGKPLIKMLDDFLTQPRRFGEVREKLCKPMGFDRSDADASWQTIMRWLMEFLPHRYTHRVYRHSEVFVLTEGEGGPVA